MINNLCWDCNNRPICRFDNDLQKLELAYGHVEHHGARFDTIESHINANVEQCKFYVHNPGMPSRDGSDLLPKKV